MSALTEAQKLIAASGGAKGRTYITKDELLAFARGIDSSMPAPADPNVVTVSVSGNLGDYAFAGPGGSPTFLMGNPGVPHRILSVDFRIDRLVGFLTGTTWETHFGYQGQGTMFGIPSGSLAGVNFFGTGEGLIKPMADYRTSTDLAAAANQGTDAAEDYFMYFTGADPGTSGDVFSTDVTWLITYVILEQ